MHVAVLIKQVPSFGEMTLGPNGRLVRDGLDLEINPYCRRAIAKGIELARATGGTCLAITLGPPAAEDALREAVAAGADDALLLTDPVFAGSDTLATARALAAALRREGPFDLILTGLNSVDSDTGQVGPELAELLDLPFASGVREMRVDGERLELGCERDDGWAEISMELPALLSVAERLCAPAKVPPEGRAAVAPDRVRRIGATDLGSGPWGEQGSPTRVGDTRHLPVQRMARKLAGPVPDQVRAAVELLVDRGVIAASGPSSFAAPAAGPRATAGPFAGAGDGPAVVAVVEPGRPRLAEELIGEANRLARAVGGRSIVVASAASEVNAAVSAGAGEVVEVAPAGSAPLAEEDVARYLAGWAAGAQPWAMLAPATSWGREVAARVAARLGAGLTGDAVELEVADARLVAWKPAFGGQLVAAITTTSPVQLATIRPGVLAAGVRPATGRTSHRTVVVPGRDRVRLLKRTRDPAAEALAHARTVVGVGRGVSAQDYEVLDPLLQFLGAELAATRKVTDAGHLPRGRQVGLTGLSIAPRLYLALGTSGKFNHTVGLRQAGTVVAVNTDPDAPFFDVCDIGIVGDWREVAVCLVAELRNLAAGYPPAG
ncbi:MAG: FAD-binding protein [Streptosporangiaceae bacterium]